MNVADRTGSTPLTELASRVFLWLAAFRRRVGQGLSQSGEDLHTEGRQMFRELQQAAQRDPKVAEYWDPASRALVYLVDEIMSSTPWEHRGWWQDNTFEKSVLNSPQKMRGILFFDELDRARKRILESDGSRRAAEPCAVELLAVFYCCLRFGFEGKYAGQSRELERESQQLLAMLSPAARRESRIYFEDSYHQTVELPPMHHSVMRLATLAALLVGLLAVAAGLRQVLRADLLGGLEASAAQAGSFFQSNQPGTAG